MKRILAVLLFATLAHAQSPRRTLDIYWVDVEGGAATLIVTPAGESVLVDTGWPRDDDRDAKRIQHAAQQAGLKRIDHLLITHYHRDHWGGVAALSKLIPIGKFYDHGRMTELTEDPKNFPVLNATYLEASGSKSLSLRPGDEIPLKRAGGSPPLRLEVLSSHGDVVKRNGISNAACRSIELQKDDPSDNARSLGFVLAFGKFRFIDLGDLTWNIEHKLACPSNLVGAVDLYQVTHHGANNSNNPALLAALQPRVAVMNNGPRKGGHPDVAKWLRATSGLEALYQVHRNVATADADNAAPEFIANLGEEKDCQGHMIQASVAADGAYTVTNTRTGQSRKYASRN